MSRVEIADGTYCRIEAFFPMRFKEMLTQIVEMSCFGDGHYNSLDTALWFAVEEVYLRLLKERKQALAEADREEIRGGAVLTTIAQMPYKEYLQSPVWKLTRDRIIKERGHICEVCGATDTTVNVHHKTYDRRGYEADTDLIVLCQPCHELFHKNGKLAESGK